MGRGRSKAGGGGGGKLYDKTPFDENKESWNDFAEKFGPKPTKVEEWDLDGYVGTWKSFDLNKKFYTDKEHTLTEKEQKTVKTLDKMIDTHKTPIDGVFTRYVGNDAIQNTLGLSDSQMGLLLQASSMNSSDMALLNKALKGTESMSKSYSSTSAVSHHMFENKYTFKREISVPKGTKAFATNAHEKEVIFGRNMKTVLDHVSYNGKHIIIHERFVGYEG